MFRYHQNAVRTDCEPGVYRKILTYSKDVMMCEITFEKGAKGNRHSHPHRQITYIAEGSFEFHIGEDVRVVSKGDSVYMEPDVEHETTCLEAGVLVDVFVPMREDFLQKQLIFVEPVFKQMIWGGNRLGTDWGYEIPGENTGECWAVSAHPNGDCRIASGTFEGMTLSQLWKEQPQLFGGCGGEKFPLLVKIIDAKDDLSIQVHPDDVYAEVHENGSFGKTECWYILDCPENASLVVGHNAGSRQELEEMIRNGKWNEFIREVPVKKGDFLQINPGTVHAIKGGLVILETQQNSDVTYRVYDYDRLSGGKPRELHIEKSIDVITAPAAPAEESIRFMGNLPVNTLNEMISCSYYQVFKIIVDGSFAFEQKYPFLIMSVIDGEGSVNGQKVRKGDHFLVPSGFGEVKLEGQAEFIASAVQQRDR